MASPLHHHRVVILSGAQRSRKPALSEAEGDLQLLFLFAGSIVAAVEWQTDSFRGKGRSDPVISCVWREFAASAEQ
jgi:hypothetical protein